MQVFHPFLMFLLCFLLVFSVTGQALAEIDSPVRIAFLTDLHYIAPSLTDYGPAFMQVITRADGKVTRYCDEIAETFIDQVRGLNVSAVVLQGDLTFNGAIESHTALASKLSALRQAGIPVYVIPGNHDVYNRNAARFSGSGYARVSSATSGDFAKIWSDFGYSQALSRDPASLSYTVDLSPQVRLLMIDVNTKGKIGVLREETLYWAELQLMQAQEEQRVVLAVSHQNLLLHNALFSTGFRMEGAAKLEELYRKYGVICNISGHMHAQHIAGTNTGLPEIAVSSATVSPCQFGLLTLYKNELEYHTRLIPVDRWAAAKGSTNQELLSFPRYARDFFNAGMNRQKPVPDTEKHAQIINDYAARLNAAYFSGNLTDFSAKDPIYRLICRSLTTTSLYLKSIEPDLGRNYTTLHYTFGGSQK